MPIANSGFWTAITPASISGTGSATLDSTGAENGYHRLIIDDGTATSLLDRKELVCTSTEPKKVGDACTQGKSTMTLKVPRLMADGTWVVDTARVIVATSVETTDVQRRFMRDMLIQALDSANFDDYFNSLVTS